MSGVAPTCALVVCGAPLAGRAAEVAAALVAGGWQLRVFLTPAAEAWVDTAVIAAAAGVPATSRLRTPNSPKPPRPEALAVVPMTFNTVAKAAYGIADTAAHSAIAEALGRRIPVVAVPSVNQYLTDHPGWAGNVATLTSWGVTWVSQFDGTTGAPLSGAAPADDAWVAEFDPDWVVRHLPEASARSH